MGLPPRFVPRDSSPIEALYLRSLPPRMNPGNRNSPSSSDSDLACTSVVVDVASQGSPTTTIVDVVEALGSAHKITTTDDEAQATDGILVVDIETTQTLEPVTSAPSQSSSEPAHTVICRWSPTCGMNLSDEYTATRKHLAEAHHMDFSRKGKKQNMNCPWPGCGSKRFQVGNAPRHLLNTHIKPEITGREGGEGNEGSEGLHEE